MEKLERCPICYGIIKVPGQKVEPGYGCQCKFGGDAHPEELWEKRKQVVYSHMYMLSTAQFNHVMHLQKELCESYTDDEKKKYLDELMSAYDERKTRPIYYIAAEDLDFIEISNEEET